MTRRIHPAQLSTTTALTTTTGVRAVRDLDAPPRAEGGDHKRTHRVPSSEGIWRAAGIQERMIYTVMSARGVRSYYVCVYA